jgi:hypothetical protein
MAGPRQNVRPPTYDARDYGLLTVVEPRYEEPDIHWRNGVQWESQCGLGSSTFDDACAEIDIYGKTRNITVANYGATPFVPFAEVDCSPVGYTEAEQFERALGAFARIEPYQVELSFWTGNVAASGMRAYPHLAANAQVLDATINPSVILQTATTVVTGATLDVVEGIARLEGALARCANGRGVLHVTPEVFDLMAFGMLLDKPRNGVMYSVAGNKVAVGAGYTGSGPDGTSTTGVHWAYATSPVFAYRSSGDPRVGTTLTENLDRAVDTVKTIAERTYVLGYDCCHFGVPISLGGMVSGGYNVAN